MEVTGGVRQLAHLLGSGLHHALLPVADVHAPEAGKGIEQLVAVVVLQPGALRRSQHHRAALFMLAPRCDRMDEMGAVECGERVGVEEGSHGWGGMSGVRWQSA